LLVGDVARPDLLGGEEETRKHAGALCRTLKDKILALPDHVMVYPTHVAGSLCGGNIGSLLATTIGYERRMNRLLQSVAETEDFEELCLDLGALPTVPPYWARMRKANVEGPAPLGVLTDPPALQVEAFATHRRDGAIVLDCRSPEAFAGGHIPDALNVGLAGSFVTWAGTVLPAGARVLLVLENPADLWEATWSLLRIGYELPVGWLAGGMRAWRISGQDIEFLSQWTVDELKKQMQRNRDLVVLDGRQPAEWSSGHIRGALHMSGGELPTRIHELPKNRSIAVHCDSGYRSSVAGSLLKARGFPVEG
jgi:hydroxyacylglutathione hydrolase